ncbi:MAG: sulfite exporter TauE/SafE family protein, partial [Chloroflexi bacterium]|nr:sulfite exporter TauE/SafE family protein [Chloroflexota bacterium]
TGLGGIDWLLVALLGGSGIVGVVAGGHLSGRVPERHLRRAFAGLVFSLAVYTLARNGTALVATITS